MTGCLARVKKKGRGLPPRPRVQLRHRHLEEGLHPRLVAPPVRVLVPVPLDEQRPLPGLQLVEREAPAGLLLGDDLLDAGEEFFRVPVRARQFVFFQGGAPLARLARLELLDALLPRNAGLESGLPPPARRDSALLNAVARASPAAGLLAVEFGDAAGDERPEEA